MEENVKVRCTCGHKYQVSQASRGHRVACPSCTREMRVPTGSTRKHNSRDMLAALGIDPDAAKNAYEAERRKALCCGTCAGPLDEAERARDVPEDQLTCESCRSAEVRSRGLPDEKKPRSLPAGRRVSESEVRARVAAYGALFLVGTAGFVHTLFGAGPIIALLVGVSVAIVGGHAITRAHEGARLAA
jgi:hypothetical protein